MRNGIISVDKEATALEVVLILIDVSISPKFNCGSVGMSTISLDTYVESFSCEHDKSLNS